MNKPPPSPKSPVGAAPAAALHRSGAVARMLRMPVGTLRVWERRYALTSTALSPGGQRLYSAEDVRRLASIKQLTDLGHAIGSLAPLDRVQLQRVVATHAQTLAATQTGLQAGGAPARAPGAAQPWRLVVVGQALGARLRRPALLRQLGRPLELLGPFSNVAEAAAALAVQPGGGSADAWLLHERELHPGWLTTVRGAAPALARGRTRGHARGRTVPVAVFYGFAADAVCESLAASGVALLREPQPDVALAQWLRLWAEASATTVAPACDVPETTSTSRWDDAALSDFAALSTTVACECPRHVAELLMQLSRFEAYSAQCAHRNPADADLHAFLGRVAADARARFEGALEQVALHEGLLLPSPAA